MKRALLSDPNPEMERMVKAAGWEPVIMDPEGDIVAQIRGTDVRLPEPFSEHGRLLATIEYKMTTRPTP